MPANSGSRTEPNSLSLWIVGICFVAIVAEGYDLFVYGTVVPSLLEYRQWAVTPQQAGFIGSLTPVGMLFGALVAGTVGDIWGRRKVVLFCVAWFSLAMGLCALAPSPGFFGFSRFLAGLGLGGCLPTITALIIEYSPVRRRNLNNALVFAGIAVGGMLAALLAIVVIPALGWRAMFFIGMFPLVTVVPLAYKFLPESIGFLLAKGRRGEAEEVARRFNLPTPQTTGAVRTEEETSDRRGRLAGIATLFSGRYLAATILFWIITFFSLLLIYGLTTWLPQIMREAGYSLGSALSFLLVFNLSSTVGLILIAVLADRLGSKPVVAGAFIAAAASIALLSFQPSLLVIYVLVFMAGLGSLAVQPLVNAYVAGHYPASGRTTALGWSLGIGRLGAITGPTYGGLVIASGFGLAWSFYAFAIPALVAALVTLLIPRSPAGTEAPTAEAATVDVHSKMPTE